MTPLSPTSSLGAQQLRPLIVPKSKPMGFCIIVQQKWPGVRSRVVAVRLYGVNVNGGIKHCFTTAILQRWRIAKQGPCLFITAACLRGSGGPSHWKHLCSEQRISKLYNRSKESQNTWTSMQTFTSNTRHLLLLLCCCRFYSSSKTSTLFSHIFQVLWCWF